MPASKDETSPARYGVEPRCFVRVIAEDPHPPLVEISRFGVRYRVQRRMIGMQCMKEVPRWYLSHRLLGSSWNLVSCSASTSKVLDASVVTKSRLLVAAGWQPITVIWETEQTDRNLECYCVWRTA